MSMFKWNNHFNTTAVEENLLMKLNPVYFFHMNITPQFLNCI